MANVHSSLHLSKNTVPHLTTFMQIFEQINITCKAQINDAMQDAL